MKVNLNEGATYDKIMKSFGNKELNPKQANHAVDICYDLVDKKIITKDQCDSIAQSVRAAAARDQDIKFATILIKIYDNDKAAEALRKDLAG